MPSDDRDISASQKTSTTMLANPSSVRATPVDELHKGKADKQAGGSELTALISGLKINVDKVSTFSFIQDADDVPAVVDTLLGLSASPPSIYVDLEGVNLSRQGTISILQIYVAPLDHTYLIDVHTMGGKTFSMVGTSGVSLKDILESVTIPKVFFDVRNDADALFSHFGIRLMGVKDLQLMELATRSWGRTYVSGLAKCIEYDAPMTGQEKRVWKAVKETGKRLFEPQLGGSYEIFNQRPLPVDVQKYCVQDVRFLPKLWELYNSRMTKDWAVRVDKAVIGRVREAQSATYQGHGPHKARGPW
ncbi:3 -5 exonuclease [Botrytis cinerea]